MSNMQIDHKRKLNELSLNEFMWLPQVQMVIKW